MEDGYAPITELCVIIDDFSIRTGNGLFVQDKRNARGRLNDIFPELNNILNYRGPL